MTILSSSTPRDFASWLIWFIVLLTLLLPQAGISKPPDVEVWQSSLDPVPWLGQTLRRRWFAVGQPVRQWLNQGNVG